MGHSQGFPDAPHLLTLSERQSEDDQEWEEQDAEGGWQGCVRMNRKEMSIGQWMKDRNVEG